MHFWNLIKLYIIKNTLFMLLVKWYGTLLFNNLCKNYLDHQQNINMIFFKLIKKKCKMIFESF